jgi:hypothetical protein
MTIVIYFDKEKKHKQIIRPTDYFNGDAASLVRDMFNTVIRLPDGMIEYTRNYDHFEIINN